MTHDNSQQHIREIATRLDAIGCSIEALNSK